MTATMSGPGAASTAPALDNIRGRDAITMNDTRDDKRCPNCKQTKPRTEFGRRKSGHSRSHCKRCESAKFAESYHADKARSAESYRRSDLKRRYNITAEDYDTMLAAQGGVCMLCAAIECGAGRKYFCVDHNHDTGVVRGLLCNSCNRALGALRDDPDLVARALRYLLADGDIEVPS